MPFKSKAQQRYMYAAASRGEIPKKTVKEWSDATDFKHLPERKEMQSLKKEAEEWGALALAANEELLKEAGWKGTALSAGLGAATGGAVGGYRNGWSGAAKGALAGALLGGEFHAGSIGALKASGALKERAILRSGVKELNKIRGAARLARKSGVHGVDYGHKFRMAKSGIKAKLRDQQWLNNEQLKGLNGSEMAIAALGMGGVGGVGATLKKSRKKRKTASEIGGTIGDLAREYGYVEY